MADYQRITSYLYEYTNGNRGENVGFIRIEEKDQQLKVSFSLNSEHSMPSLKLYFYYYSDGTMYGILWDEIPVTSRHYEYKETFHSDDIFPDEHTLVHMNGILLYESEHHFFGSEWNEQPINLRLFSIINKETPHLEEYMEALSLHEQHPEMPVKKEEILPEVVDTSAKRQSYPELSPYPSPDFSSCVRLTLPDLASFSFLPSELSGNGFLKMQVQNYGHLFLGEKKLTDHHYIGIPGIFTNQRNFVAHLFGFPEFITVPHREQKTGSFGYWIMTIGH